jgi:hypothetical protein
MKGEIAKRRRKKHIFSNGNYVLPKYPVAQRRGKIPRFFLWKKIQHVFES